MKKILYSVLALAMTAFTFTSCEDVPAPYGIPEGGQGGQDLPEGVYIDQDFTSSLGGFTSVSESGTLEWYNDFKSAMCTGFQDFNGDGEKENQAGVTWLVSPEIDLTEAQKAYISVNMAMRYERGDINENNSILISKNYTGNVNTATWEQLTYNTDDLNGTEFVFTEKNMNIPADYLGGKVVVAFRHTCTETYSSTWEVKSILIQEGEVEETPDTPDVPLDGVYIDETFASDFGVFSVNTITGTPWIIDFSTAKASGYDNASKTTTPSESYLVSTPIDLSASKGATILFEYILRYVTNYGEPVPGVNNKVLVTDNYTGDPATTTWTDITGTLTEGRDWTTFADYSAAIPTEFIGKSNVVIALYYSCEDKSGTWEVKNLKVVEGDGGSGEEPGGDDDPGTSGEGLATVTKSENIVTMVDPNVTTTGSTVTCDLNTYGWVNAEEVENVTLDDGTTISFSIGEGTTTPKFYTGTKGVRLYALNTMAFSASKKIAKIVLTCDIYNNTNQVGNPQLYTEINGNTWTLVNDWTENKGGTQLRVQTIEITYAE